MEQITLFILAVVTRRCFFFSDRDFLIGSVAETLGCFGLRAVHIQLGLKLLPANVWSQRKGNGHKQTNIMCVCVPLCRNVPPRVSGTLLSDAFN